MARNRTASVDLTGGYSSAFEQDAYSDAYLGRHLAPVQTGHLIGDEITQHFLRVGVATNNGWSLNKMLAYGGLALTGIILLLAGASAIGIDIGFSGGAFGALIEMKAIMMGLAMTSTLVSVAISNAWKNGKGAGIVIGLGTLIFGFIGAMFVGTPEIQKILQESIGQYFTSATQVTDGALAVANAKVEAAKQALDAQEAASKAMENNGYAGDDTKASILRKEAQQAYSDAVQEQARLRHDQQVGSQFSMARLFPLGVGVLGFAAIAMLTNMFLAGLLTSLWVGALSLRNSHNTNTQNKREIELIKRDPSHAEVLAARYISRAKQAYMKGLRDKGVSEEDGLKLLGEAFSDDAVATMKQAAAESVNRSLGISVARPANQNAGADPQYNAA